MSPKAGDAVVRTVLVVDDDPDIQLLLRLELSAEGYDVVTADDGQQAIDRITSLQPDAVLLDIMMPVVDGWSVLEALPDPKPAVIVISGLGSDRDEQYRKAVELGALGYVPKPFDSDQLLQLVARTIDLDEAERAAHRRALLEHG